MLPLEARDGASAAADASELLRCPAVAGPRWRAEERTERGLRRAGAEASASHEAAAASEARQMSRALESEALRARCGQPPFKAARRTAHRWTPAGLRRMCDPPRMRRPPGQRRWARSYIARSDQTDWSCANRMAPAPMPALWAAPDGLLSERRPPCLLQQPGPN